MKAFRIPGLIALAATLSVPMAAMAAPPSTIAIKTNANVVLDGHLDEWGKAKSQLVSLKKGVDNTDNWDEASDMGGIFYTMYDDRNIYLAADIHDDMVLQEYDGLYIYQGDCLEYYFDTDSSDNGESTYSEDDWQIGLTPGTGATAPAHVVWQQLGEREIPGIRVASTKTDKGYTLEAEIPVSALGVVPKAGMRVGYDFAIDDTDTPGSKGDTSFSFYGQGNGWQNPQEFGTLIFQ